MSQEAGVNPWLAPVAGVWDAFGDWAAANFDRVQAEQEQRAVAARSAGDWLNLRNVLMAAGVVVVLLIVWRRFRK